jgi:hypothetical protein
MSDCLPTIKEWRMRSLERKTIFRPSGITPELQMLQTTGITNYKYCKMQNRKLQISVSESNLRSDACDSLAPKSFATSLLRPTLGLSLVAGAIRRAPGRQLRRVPVSQACLHLGGCSWGGAARVAGAHPRLPQCAAQGHAARYAQTEVAEDLHCLYPLLV